MFKQTKENFVFEQINKWTPPNFIIVRILFVTTEFTKVFKAADFVRSFEKV